MIIDGDGEMSDVNKDHKLTKALADVSFILRALESAGVDKNRAETNRWSAYIKLSSDTERIFALRVLYSEVEGLRQVINGQRASELDNLLKENVDFEKRYKTDFAGPFIKSIGAFLDGFKEDVGPLITESDKLNAALYGNVKKINNYSSRI